MPIQKPPKILKRTLERRPFLKIVFSWPVSY